MCTDLHYAVLTQIITYYNCRTHIVIEATVCYIETYLSGPFCNLWFLGGRLR